MPVSISTKRRGSPHPSHDMTPVSPDLAALAAVAAFAPHLAQAFASLACDLALVLDAQGCVTRVALSANSTLDTATIGWVGRCLPDIVTADTRHKVDSLLEEVFSGGLARRREVNVPAPGRAADIPLAFPARRLGADGPTLAVGHDLRAVAAMQQRFLRVQQELERGYGLALGSLPDPANASPTSPESSEQLNEASRAAFAAWLRAERFAAESGVPSAPVAARKSSPRRKR
jgi:hypothetical protein